MNKLGKIFIITGIFLITLSISLIINNRYNQYNAGIKSQKVLNTLKENYNEDNLKVVNQKEITNEIKDMKTTNIDGYDYIGWITIPSLKLELPIMSEYDYTRLNIAPCRYYGSIYTNDLIICAHSYKTHFKYLNKLKQKDLVIITDINGNNYIYEVVTIEVLKPNQVSEMINNDYDLTLYTCTNDGQNRITVRCNKVLDLA